MVGAIKQIKESKVPWAEGARLGVQLHLVSVSEAAVVLGRSIRTLRYWQANGRMPARIRIGRQMMYQLDELLALRVKGGFCDCN